jgi:hypothetical protein
MRKTALWIAIFMLVVGAAAMAANQYGIADKRNVTFADPVRVGDTLLPAGEYQITHQMQGSDHIMTFKQLARKNPVEVRVKCTLVPLKAAAQQTEFGFKVNGNEKLLNRMVFRGERAEHLF